MARSVRKIYGTALFEAGLSSGNLSRLYEDVQLVRATFGENPALSELLAHPRISREEKMQVLENVFSGRVSDELMGLFAVITDKNRETELDGILETLLSLTKEHLGIGICYVETPAELSPAQKEKVEQKILSTTSYREMEMHYSVDESLLGGMVIRVGDKVVDSSIRTRLKNLERELMSIQLSTEV